MYPTDRASAAQVRPTRELTGAAHAGIRATSSAASPAIMVFIPAYEVVFNILALRRPSRPQSSSKLIAHRIPRRRSEISERTPIWPPTRDLFHLKTVFDRLGASAL